MCRGLPLGPCSRSVTVTATHPLLVSHFDFGLSCKHSFGSFYLPRQLNIPTRKAFTPLAFALFAIVFTVWLPSVALAKGRNGFLRKSKATKKPTAKPTILALQRTRAKSTSPTLGKLGAQTLTEQLRNRWRLQGQLENQASRHQLNRLSSQAACLRSIQASTRAPILLCGPLHCPSLTQASTQVTSHRISQAICHPWKATRRVSLPRITGIIASLQPPARQ